MIEKTTGIVLRVSPFSRTSHIVTWFTSDFGKVTTLVKGAQRVKSAFLGQYDLFYTCELLFYSRDRNGIHIIRECSPIETRSQLRGNWRSAVCASYFCDLVSRMTPPHSPSPQFFRLLEASLSFLCANGTTRSLVSWFELRSTGIAGFSPRLSGCTRCGAAATTQGDFRFSCDAGGIVCPSCAVTNPAQSAPLDAGVLSTMQAWQTADRPADVVPMKCLPGRLVDIERILGMFLDYHVQALPAGRSIALELLPLGNGAA
ncbi:MAG: DNA repair protein RecO [bacterium]